MDKFIKVVMYILIYFISILSVDVIANVDIKSFSIAKSVKGVPTVIGTLHIDNKLAGISLLNNVNQKPSLNLLSNYYQSGKMNKTDALINMSFTPDGSRSWMVNELVNIPDKFNGFKKLDNVITTDLIRWGEYELYGVDWYFSGNRKVGSWIESVICQSKDNCKISNLILNDTENSRLFSAMLQNISKNSISRDFDFKHSISIFPLYGKKEFPLNIHFNINWLPKPILLGEKSDKQDRGKLTILHKYLRELKQTQALKLTREENNKVMMSQIKKYWDGFTPQKLFPVVIDGKVAHYLPLAFLQRLNNLKSYEVYGLLEAEHESYVIGNGLFNQEKILFVLPIDNRSAKLKHIQKNKGLMDLVFSPLFYKTLQELIKRKN